MALISTQNPTVTGIGLVFTAASVEGDIPQGDTAAWDPGLTLLIRNDSGAVRTVTIATADTADGLTVQDVAVEVPAGGTSAVALGDAFRMTTTGSGTFTPDVATGVSFAVVGR